MNRSTKCPSERRAERGFTLLELMVVVSIVGLLAAVALPNYRAHVRKANRTAAEGYLLEVGERQGQYMLDARQYFSGTTLVPVPPDVAANFTIDVDADNTTTPPGCLITATPIGDQAKDGPAITLDCAGNKSPANMW